MGRPCAPVPPMMAIRGAAEEALLLVMVLLLLLVEERCCLVDLYTSQRGINPQRDQKRMLPRCSRRRSG